MPRIRITETSPLTVEWYQGKTSPQKLGEYRFSTTKNVNWKQIKQQYTGTATTVTDLADAQKKQIGLLLEW